jgi:hypothetical protein
LVLGLPVTFAALAVGLTSSTALGLGAVAMAISASPLEGLVRGRGLMDHGTVRLLKLIMAFAGLPAVSVFAFAAALASPLVAAPGSSTPAWQLLVIIVAVGLLIGYALVVLVRGVQEHIQLLTLAGGAMCLVAGASAVLGLSALPSAACAGAVVVNRSVFPHRMLRVAHSLERPMLVALLASWASASFSWEAFVLLTVVRIAAAWLAGRILQIVARKRDAGVWNAGLGFGLLPQGELALGLLVAMVSFFPETGGVLEAVVVAIICNNLIAVAWMRRTLVTASSEVNAP